MAIEETITINAGEAIASLDELGAAAEEAAAKFAAAMDKLKVPDVAGGGGADKLAASMDAAAAKIDASVEKIEAAFDKLADVGDSAASGLDAVGAAADSAAGPLDAVAAAADDAAAAQDRLADSADMAGASLDRSAVAGDAAAGAAAAGAESRSKLGEYALGAAVVIGYATDQAMKFNSSMTLLNTQAGVSKTQLPALTKGVLELAGATGQSPGNLAESLYHVASNMESMPGTTTVKMLDAVKIAAEGASVGHSNLVDTTTALTSVLASGIPGAKNYSQAMGAINATVGVGEMNMQQLAEAMGTGVVPVVKGYGLTLKDVGAALATYGDLNIRGAKAGTELRMAVQAMAVPVATGTAELNKLGLSTTSLSKDMESGGLMKALDDLNDRFKANGITAKNEGAVITDIFGKKAGAGLALLLENMDRVQSKYPALTKGADDFGQAWATTQQTAQQRLKQLESGAQAMAITLGNIALPSADKILGGLDKGLEFVQSHAFASKGLTLGLGTLIAGGLSKGIFSGVESSLQGLGKLGSLLKIPGMDKLANIGQGSSATGAAALDTSAANLDGAAEALSGAAAKLGGAEGLPGAGKIGGEGARAGEAAGAGEGAGVATAGETVGATAGMFAAPALGAGLGLALGLYLNQFKKYDHPAPADQQGPHAPQPASAGTAWKQYDNLAPKDWSSVLGGSAPYTTAQNIPASRFATVPGSTQGAVLGRFGPISGTPQQFATQGSTADQFGLGGHPGTVKLPAPDTSALDAAKVKVQAAMTAIDSAISKADAHPGKIPAPDISAMEQAKTKIQADLTAIDTAIAKTAGKPASIPAPDLSALTSAAGKASSAANAINQAVTAAIGKPAKAAAPDLSAYAAAAGTARSDGVAISAGLASGILAGEGAVVAAAGQVASAAAAAMAHAVQSHSPSKVTEKIGQDFDAGFTQGIAGNATTVKAASAQIGSDSVASLLQGLVGGQSNVQNAIQAVMGAAANPDAVTSIQQTIQQLVADVPASDTGLVKWLTAQQGKLSALANQQGALMAQINDAQQIATQQIANASITSAYGYTPALAASGGPISSSATVQGMQLQAQDQSSYAAQLTQLKKMGLNATSLSQLSQEGASQGLPEAMGLAQGGKGAIAQANAAEAQIMAASKQIGAVGGTAMYQAGQQAGQGLDAGLKAALDGVDKDMSKIAQAIITKIQKTLGTSSSSASSGSSAAAAGSTAATAAAGSAGLGKVSAAAGSAAAGLDKVNPAGSSASGALDKVASAAAAAATALGKIVSAGGSGHAQPMGGGGHSAPSGGGGTVIVNVTVQGSLVSQQDLADHIQTVLLAKGSNNWQAGLSYQGRPL